MVTKPVSTVGVALLFLSHGAGISAEEKSMPVVRMAELEIEPAKLEAFKASVKEEMEISVRVEPGVLAIYAVAEKEHPAKLRFFEMYADEAAFQVPHRLAALQRSSGRRPRTWWSHESSSRRCPSS